MLGDFIRELTKMKANNTINSETVLAWAKRVQAQRVHTTAMSSITEAKEFDRIKVSKRSHKDASKKTTEARVPMRQPCAYCRSRHPPQQCPTYGNKHALDARKLATSRQYARAERPGK